MAIVIGVFVLASAGLALMVTENAMMFPAVTFALSAIWRMIDLTKDEIIKKISEK